MNDQLLKILIQLLDAANDLGNRLGYEGIGGQEWRAYAQARTALFKLIPELELEVKPDE